ncbi:MAG: cation:proton antiporter [Gammaproteobacteria bacterium]
MTVVSQPLSRWLRMPYSSTLVMVGFAASELAVGLGVDTGIRAGSFHDLIFFVFLPILVFEAAFCIDIRLLRQNLLPVLFLATVIMLVSALLTGVGVYYGIAHPTGFPWIAALITGALLAATDPAAVVDQLKSLGASQRLSTLIEGESLFNDATAIVLFSLFVAAALEPSAPTGVPDMAWQFLQVFLGGAGVGLAAGVLAVWLMRVIGHADTRIVITILAAYGAFFMAESLLHVSGIMATLICGLVLSRQRGQLVEGPSQQQLLVGLWQVAAHLANAFVFLLMGVTVTLAMFQERWLAMLIAIVAVLVARLISVYAGLWLLRPLLKPPIDKAWPPVIVWTGLRGSVALALALSLPVELEYWWTIQSIAFGVVLFSVFVQAPTARLLIR